jgi:hypothetical protein
MTKYDLDITSSIKNPIVGFTTNDDIRIHDAECRDVERDLARYGGLALEEYSKHGMTTWDQVAAYEYGDVASDDNEHGSEEWKAAYRSMFLTVALILPCVKRR